MDRYAERIATLKAEIFDIGGRVAMLSPSNHEGRAYWHRAADKADRELRTLIEHSDELRELDGRIEHVADRINAAASRQKGRAESWQLAARFVGTLGAMLLVLSVWWIPSAWMPVAGFALVVARFAARWQSRLARYGADDVIQDYGRTLAALEAEHAGILATGQSASPRNPASTPERSDTPSHASTLELIRPSE